MKFEPWATSLTTRIAIILSLALIVVQLLSAYYFLKQQSASDSTVHQHSSIAQLKQITTALEPLETQQRLNLLPAINNSNLIVRLVENLQEVQGFESSNDALTKSLSSSFGRKVFVKGDEGRFSKLRDINLKIRTELSKSNDTEFNLEDSAIWIQLNDGSWLVFETTLSSQKSGWPLHISAQILLLCIVIIILAVIAARQMTRPIRTFSDAAQRLGMDVNAPPIPVHGSKELQKATIAFNTMQTRLQRYVEDQTRMLAAISHDLRTSLTRLRLRIEFIDDENQREKAERDLYDMQEMLSATLTFARDDATNEELQVLDLAKLLHTLCDDLVDMGEDIQYLGPESVTYKCRPLALQRALLNVLTNAVKYGNKAQVELQTSLSAQEILVTDNGPGIPEDMLEKVFEPFERLDKARNRSTGGSGLGLSIARSVVQSHGGKITLSNLPSAGLLVRLVLPISNG